MQANPIAVVASFQMGALFLVFLAIGILNKFGKLVLSAYGDNAFPKAFQWALSFPYFLPLFLIPIIVWVVWAGKHHARFIREGFSWQPLAAGWAIMFLILATGGFFALCSLTALARF